MSRNQNSAYNFGFPTEYCQNSEILREFGFIQTSLSTSTLVIKIKILLRTLLFQQNFVRILTSQQNFVPLSKPILVWKSKFCSQFCFSSRILSKFRYTTRILLHTDIIIYIYPCHQKQILLRTVLFQQISVRILISQQNLVSLSTPILVWKSKFCLEFWFSNRIMSQFSNHSRILFHYLHLSLSRNQNSAENFAFPAEFCQNSDITAEFCFNIYTYPCLVIKILLRIFLFEHIFARILISQQNFVSISTPTLVS